MAAEPQKHQQKRRRRLVVLCVLLWRLVWPFGHTRQSKSMTKSTKKFFWAKEKRWKSFTIFIFCVQGGALIPYQHCEFERSLKKTFLQLGLDRINKPPQKSIFKAVFWVYTRALDPGASDGHQEDGLVDHLRYFDFKNIEKQGRSSLLPTKSFSKNVSEKFSSTKQTVVWLRLPAEKF